MTPVQLKSSNVIDEVLLTSYYVVRLNKLLELKGMTYEDLKTAEDKKLIVFWNDFWDILPDSPEIRTPVFFKICELAEMLFDSEDDDDFEEDEVSF